MARSLGCFVAKLLAMTRVKTSTLKRCRLPCRGWRGGSAGNLGPVAAGPIGRDGRDGTPGFGPRLGQKGADIGSEGLLQGLGRHQGIVLVLEARKGPPVDQQRLGIGPADLLG